VKEVTNTEVISFVIVLKAPLNSNQPTLLLNASVAS